MDILYSILTIGTLFCTLVEHALVMPAKLHKIIIILPITSRSRQQSLPNQSAELPQSTP